MSSSPTTSSPRPRRRSWPSSGVRRWQAAKGPALATTTEAIEVVRPGPAPAARRLPAAWLVVAPFFLYAFAFLILPSIALGIGAFQSEDGAFTLSNVSNLFKAQYLDAYKTSILLSLATALGGGLLGVLMAYAVFSRGAPAFLRTFLTTFSGVAANFAGVPLAFAFIATLGTVGLATRFIDSAFGINLYAEGFTLFNFTGLVVTYVYFQIPLMILLIAPAIDGLRAEWREAAANIGASAPQYWRFVGIPILAPSLLGALLVLFGNSFAAYATAYALTSGHINIVPLLIGELKAGNVLSDPHQGDALALGMLVVMAVTMTLYVALERRAARWMR
jgi:putative spermidine/putrescine transport system permease protein